MNDDWPRWLRIYEEVTLFVFMIGYAIHAVLTLPFILLFWLIMLPTTWWQCKNEDFRDPFRIEAKDNLRELFSSMLGFD